MYQAAIFCFLTLIPKITSLDFCDTKSAVLTNTTSYLYKGLKEENCNCARRTSCLRKCCAVGFYASKGVCLRYDNPDFVLNIPVYDGKKFVRNVSANTNILAGVMSCDFFIFGSNEKDWFYLQERGGILTSEYGLVENDFYCVDDIKDKGLAAFICYDRITTEATSRKIYAAGMIISMPFLLLTFIAYALLPDRNLHMKALMFYVINLMFSYLLLVIIQLTESQFAEVTCKSLGYFCLFFFLVSFFWMNVICIDIWWGFSGLRGFTGSQKTAERKRFIFYCIYAWGMPVIHVLIVYLIDSVAKENSVLKPDIGNGQCFLKRGFPELLYFYGPMAILITINVVLFTITALKIRKIKRETAMLKKEDSKRHSYENDRQIFNLYLKLLFAMGVNWSMEIISWAVIWAEEAPEAIWYLTDFCNAIYGVFIFFIFVFKRSIWKLLKKRYYTFIGKHHLAHSMTMTNTTRVTSYSTTASTMQETPHGGDNDTSTLKNEA
ncbi:G-protein coupled receptor Mth2-like isoform X4 [Tribolium madens]|uniref:G-protein coupled receptor Mth2-like isoform X4 n=1 Tax=Tribolium madens TaxID=41895 RepID=UPI001CF741F8|nr:G-protein coupled receptor Mth2-like isoform X4 [Tribolium madens]